MGHTLACRSKINAPLGIMYHTLPSQCSSHQKNRHQINIIMNNPNPAKGPYYAWLAIGFPKGYECAVTCLSINSQLILTAAFRYFLLSSRSLPLISPILSKLSPRYSRSSIFFVMTLVTSFNSSFSLSRFAVALLSWYVFLVLWMNVSNSTKAYGLRLGERYCVLEYVVVNSVARSER